MEGRSTGIGVGVRVDAGTAGGGSGDGGDRSEGGGGRGHSVATGVVKREVGRGRRWGGGCDNWDVFRFGGWGVW